MLVFITHFFFYEFKNWSKSNRKKEFKKLFLILSPIAIFLPFLINSVIYGTPSTQSNSNTLTNLFSAISSGEILNSVKNSVSLPWILLALPSIIIFDLKKIIIVIQTFLALIFIFFSIDASLLGASKYQIEWFLPFSILGLVLTIKFLIFSIA